MPTALGPGAVCCNGADPECEVVDCPKNSDSTPATPPADAPIDNPKPAEPALDEEESDE